MKQSKSRQRTGAQSTDGVTELAGCKRWHCRAAQYFSFPSFCGLDFVIFKLLFKERVIGKRRLVLFRLKYKLFVLGTRLCYMISAMGAPRHHFPVQTTSINNSC